MHSPLSTQEFAHLREVCGPSPLRRMSMTPATTARGSASAIPAAPVIGQASKHLPHWVQASAMLVTRAERADSKVPVMVRYVPKETSIDHTSNSDVPPV